MHWALHYMPDKVALYLVGVATMFMFVALTSGIVVHKKIFKDFFTFRPAKGQRSWLDAHNVSSVMALPFFLMITYSGLVFYTYEYLPSVKLAVYGSGEQAEKTFSRETDGEVYADVARSGTPAPMAPIGPMLAQAEARWGATVPIHHASGAGQRTRTDQRRRAGGAQAQDSLARWDHASGHVAAGVHAAACGAGATATAAPHPLPRRAGTQRQAARAGGAARGRGARAGRATRRVRSGLCAPPTGTSELGQVA
jgi:uncharacterized iron-regulated membrane protein